MNHRSPRASSNSVWWPGVLSRLRPDSIVAMLQKDSQSFRKFDGWAFSFSACPGMLPVGVQPWDVAVAEARAEFGEVVKRNQQIQG